MAPQSQMSGRTIALMGDTGAGKTTLCGEYAKQRFKARKQRTRLYSRDLGGYDSILPLVKVGVMEAVEFDPEKDDPWLWMNNAAEGRGLAGEPLDGDIGLVVFDSATNISEGILHAITKSNAQIGQQKTQKFSIAGGKLQVGINNEAHYGVVQGFMLDQIWKSTWLARKGLDVIWTFALDRSEKQDSTPVLGPKLAGHALTTAIPKWFKYTFRVVSIPVQGQPSRHLLYIQEQPEIGGVGMSFGNARYPLDAATPLPAIIEPASLVEAISIIERGQEEAEEALRAELGL